MAGGSGPVGGCDREEAVVGEGVEELVAVEEMELARRNPRKSRKCVHALTAVNRYFLRFH